MTEQRKDRGWERGTVRFGPIVMMLVIVGGIYLAYKIVPVKIAYYNFVDAMGEQVKFASGRRIDPDGVRGNLMNKARELEVPVRAEDIVIVWTTNHISITATYAVDLDLLGYKKHWVMDARAEGPLFD